VFPHLQPPNLTAYESDSAELTAQFDAVAASLKEIQEDTTSMRTAAEEQKRTVEQSVQEVDASVKELKSGEMKTRDELREIRAEVDSIRELLPRVRVLNFSED
jgi:peroxin-14